MASNYVDLYHNVDNDTMTEQEGLELHGRDGVFCTSPVYADIPLLTENQDLARAINELFGQGTGAITGDFRAVIDDDVAIVQIVLEKDGYSDNTYGYSFDVWSDEIKTETTVGETTTTTTQTFEKRIITQLFNSDGELLLGTEYNSDTGEITRYYDGTDTDIHLAEWRTEAVESKEMSAKAEVAAIAWCIARNFEQSQSLEIQKKMYRKGLKQGVEGGADIKEDYTQDSTSIDMTTDEKGGISEPFIGSLTEGIYCHNSDGSYVYMWLDMSYVSFSEDNDSLTSTGRMVYETYNSSGALTYTRYEIGPSGWNRRKVDPTDGHLIYVGTHTNLWIDDNGLVYATYKTVNYDDGKTYHQKIYWGSVGRDVVRIGNIPPEIIS